MPLKMYAHQHRWGWARAARVTPPARRMMCEFTIPVDTETVVCLLTEILTWLNACMTTSKENHPQTSSKLITNASEKQINTNTKVLTSLLCTNTCCRTGNICMLSILWISRDKNKHKIKGHEYMQWELLLVHHKSLEAQCVVDIYTVMLNGDEISHWILVLGMFQLQLLYESLMFEIMQSKDSKICEFYSKFTYCTTNGFPVNVKGRSNIAAMAWCFAWDCIHAHTHMHTPYRSS